MNPKAAGGFCCPVCGKAVKMEENRLLCIQGHSFDLAKESYAYLLPAQKKHAKIPGDSREMVQARQRFLAGGQYGLFARALAELCAESTDENRQCHVVDAGCGEGYYDRAILPAVAEKCPRACLIGYDISREAVRLAARAQKQEAAFAVASSFAAPVRTGWADLLVNVFSPMAREEFLRMLRPGGRLLYAVPGPDHLFGLKQVLYETPYKNPVVEVEYPGFTLKKDVLVQDEITLQGQQIPDLFAMTPYYWKTPRQGAERLAQTTQLKTPIQFRFLVYEKN